MVNVPMDIIIIYTEWKMSVFGVFLVRLFPHSDWIRRDMEHFAVSSPNAGKFGPEKSKCRHFLRSVMEEEEIEESSYLLF